MSSPAFLFAKESNPALLHILLETISNIVEHQHAQNPILLYAIIRSHTNFQALQHFDLDQALSEVEERKKSKEERELGSRRTLDQSTRPATEPATPTTPATAFSVGDEGDDDDEHENHETKPLSEKARGKLPEGVDVPRRESLFSIRSLSGILTPTAEKKDFYPNETWVVPDDDASNNRLQHGSPFCLLCR